MVKNFGLKMGSNVLVIDSSSRESGASDIPATWPNGKYLGLANSTGPTDLLFSTRVMSP